MKNFIQTLTLVLFTVFCVQLNAQSITIKGGVNFSKTLDEDKDRVYSEDYKIKNGFHLGATYDFHINETFSFQPGILFSSKGAKVDNTTDGVKLQGKTILNYIEIPLSFIARQNLNSNGMRVYELVGPYLGFGVDGKVDLEQTANGVTTTLADRPIEWGSDDTDDLKSFDFGLSFGVGLEINNFLVGVSYDLGLSNLAANDANEAKFKNRNIKVTFGYMFGK